jgi:hypothetical protein
METAAVDGWPLMGLRLSTAYSRSAFAKHLFCRKEREANFPQTNQGF